MNTSEVLTSPFGEIYEIDNDESSLSMRLPDDSTHSRALSGWIYTHYLDAHLVDVSLMHSSASFFVPIAQFPLSMPEENPLFRAFGKDARKALEIVKDSYLSFNPNDFDTDGYKI